MAEHYELVIYTASLSKYADPLLDWLDPEGLCSYRLYREHCTFYNGIFVKDLSRLARDLKDTIIIDNSPASYLMHPECALPITSWYDDMADTELYLLTPILNSLSKVEDVRDYIKSIVLEDKVLFNKANQILSGGKMGDRSQSQQPALRNLKENDSEFLSNAGLNPQSGDISKDKINDSNKSNKNEEPALSYFKSFQSVSRKSKTSNNISSKVRAGSQRRNTDGDPNKLHFMPLVEGQTKHPIDTVRNGWVSKLDKDLEITATNTYTKELNTESADNTSSRGQLRLKSNDIIFKRNDVKTSSITRSYRKKYRPEQPSPARYQQLTARNSGEFRTVKRKRELMLYGIGRNSQPKSRLDSNTLKPKQLSSPNSPAKSRNRFMTNSNSVATYNFVSNNEPQVESTMQMSSKGNIKLSKILSEIGNGTYSKEHRSYINKMINQMNTTNGMKSPLANLTNGDSSVRMGEMAANTNHRQTKMNRFTSSKNLPFYTPTQLKNNFN